jgi:tRNA G18 (ribose-2'-O)-methylase SpoU
MERKSKRTMIAVCHNIRSAHNVGSIFRTADAIGVAKIYLTGYTPAPKHPGISKTALGAEDFVSWEKKSELEALLQRLKKEKFEIVALEQDKKSIPLDLYKPKKKMVLVLGNEVRGLSRASLAKCDKIVEIPMRGKKESLNVAVAFGIAVYSMGIL